MKKLRILLLFFVVGSSAFLWAGPSNIAPFAKVEASSELSAAFSANNVTDGLIGIENKGECRVYKLVANPRMLSEFRSATERVRIQRKYATVSRHDIVI